MNPNNKGINFQNRKRKLILWRSLSYIYIYSNIGYTQVQYKGISRLCLQPFFKKKPSFLPWEIPRTHVNQLTSWCLTISIIKYLTYVPLTIERSDQLINHRCILIFRNSIESIQQCIDVPKSMFTTFHSFILFLYNIPYQQVLYNFFIKSEVFFSNYFPLIIYIYIYISKWDNDY